MNKSSSQYQIFILYFLLATGLTALFWLPLWLGGGFVGGDLYSYFFPQKVLYAESLNQLEIPLWNNRTGWGYPLLGESQTGVFYPFNLALYQIFSPNQAYHANQLIHYIIAFIASILFARKTRISKSASLIVALVFVYGWFPARACVEWGIVTGAWLPVTLLFLESFLQTRLWRYLILLSSAICLQLLAGHFELAFITHLTLILYLFLKLFLTKNSNSSQSHNSSNDFNFSNAAKIKLISLIALFMFLGGMMASIQLLPTYELKKLSQRESINKNHELEFGSIPIWYLEQTIRPAKWYTPFKNRNELFGQHPPFNQARTNEVEAHLYFGLIPLAITLWSCMNIFRAKQSRSLIWIIIAILFGIYTTGILLPITKYIPGFQYFQGPGRYGIATTFAIAMAAGLAIDQFFSQKFNKPKSILLLLIFLFSIFSFWSLASDADYIQSELGGPHKYLIGSIELKSTFWLITGLISLTGLAFGLFLFSKEPKETQQKGKWLICSAIFLITLSEFWIISRNINFATLISDPPINHLEESSVKKILKESPQPVRIWSPGANFPNVLGCSSTPVYLTFGPSVYFDKKWSMPHHKEDGKNLMPAEGQIDWLKNNGVTHLISYDPLNENDWQIKLLWQGFDPVLNPAWARYREPIYLYQIKKSLGRAYLLNQNKPVNQSTLKQIHPDNKTVSITEYKANMVQIEVENETPSILVLTDLNFPGWNVTVDGISIEQTADNIESSTIFREVALDSGKHKIIWSYESKSIYWGMIFTLIAFFSLATIGHIAFWHPKLLQAVLKLPETKEKP